MQDHHTDTTEKNWAPELAEAIASAGWTIRGLPADMTAEQAEAVLEGLLEELGNRRAPAVPGVPKFCPSWCDTDHQLAIDQGCDPEDAGVHLSDDVVGRLDKLSNPYTGTVIRPGGAVYYVKAISQAEGRWGSYPFVEVEIEDRTPENTEKARIVLNLTSSDARTLARQLSHYADLIDLP